MAFNIDSFRKTLLYQSSTSVSQFKVNLKQIAEQDKLAEKQAKKYSTIAVILGVLTILSFIIAIRESPMEPLGTVVLVVLFVATVVTAIIASRWNRLDIRNLRYLLPERLVDMLSRDMARDELLTVRLDFSKPIEKRKKVSTQPYPARRGWKEDSFEDPWLQMEGRLLDNTVFDFRLQELSVTRYGWKRGRSGKRKFKRKTKPKGFEAALLLKFPRKKYGAITVMASDLENVIKLPQKVVLKQLKVNDHQLLLRIKIASDYQQLWQEDEILDGLYRVIAQLFLSAYQGLNLSKELSKANS